MSSNTKVRLITKWFVGSKEYRLLASASYSTGYEDAVILERDDKDALGDPRWVTVSQWSGADARGTVTEEEEDFRALTSLVKDLLRERDQARALVENAAQRERMEAGHA